MTYRTPIDQEAMSAFFDGLTKDEGFEFNSTSASGPSAPRAAADAECGQLRLGTIDWGLAQQPSLSGTKSNALGPPPPSARRPTRMGWINSTHTTNSLSNHNANGSGSGYSTTERRDENGKLIEKWKNLVPR